MKSKTSPAARKFISKHISRHMKKYHMPQKQAIAVALTEARDKGYNVGKQTATEGYARGKKLYGEYRRKRDSIGFGLFRD